MKFKSGQINGKRPVEVITGPVTIIRDGKTIVLPGDGTRLKKKPATKKKP